MTPCYRCRKATAAVHPHCWCKECTLAVGNRDEVMVLGDGDFLYNYQDRLDRAGVLHGVMLPPPIENLAFALFKNAMRDAAMKLADRASDIGKVLREMWARTDERRVYEDRAIIVMESVSP